MGNRIRTALAGATFAALAFAGVASAQVVGYGATANGTLFTFDPAAPAGAVTVGNMGIVPEALDFRPGTTQLYAIDVGPVTTQLYTVDRTTAAVTPVGAGFPTTVAGSYDLSGNNQFGFDFNPRTLQGDGSVRIRLVSNNSRANLRLNSNTGAVANVDTQLAFAPPNTDAPFVDASAYINSAQSTLPSAGVTTLYAMDMRNDELQTQNPPNAGTLNPVGPFGFGIDGNPGAAFDIVSTNPLDDTIGDELAFAAFQRSATAGGAYLLYDVNLATGATTNGRLVGGGLDFTGGMAMLVPEPGAFVALGLGATALLRRRR